MQRAQYAKARYPLTCSPNQYTKLSPATRKVAFEDAMFQVDTSETSMEPVTIHETVEEAIENFLEDF